MADTARPRRAEHLGSLLRPKEVIALAYSRDAAARRQAEDGAITAVVRDQTDIGLRSITDGEYRRTLFWGTFFNGLEGFSEVPFDKARLRTYMPHIQAQLENGWTPPALICTGKIRHPGRSSHLDELSYMQQLVGPDRAGDIKLTIPTPNWYHIQYRQGHAYTADAYDSDEAYFADLAAAYRQELRLLYDAGLRRVQIDDPNLSYFCSTAVAEAWAQDPLNGAQTADDCFRRYVRWYDDCFRDLPPDLCLGMHICRGNFTDGRYWAQGSYDRIARALFRDCQTIRTFYLEYDSPRAGDFAPLRHLPPHKHVVLGVVTTKNAALEDEAELRARVHAAAEAIAEGSDGDDVAEKITKEQALQQLSVSPQCGFASHSVEDRLTREDMLAKLKLVRSLADSLWPGEP